jgi:hypothetical protein
VLDARGFFPAIRPVEHQNEFGATIGGPIIKSKLFFFFSYDGWRYRVASPTQFATVPTLKMRQGDFSELPVAIYDPTTTVRSHRWLRTHGVPREHHSVQPHFRDLESYQSLLPAPTNSGLPEQLPGARCPWRMTTIASTQKWTITSLPISASQASTRTASGVSPGHTERPAPAFRKPFCRCRTRIRGLVTEIPTVVQAKA